MNRKTINYKKLLLSIVAGSAIISVALVAPNALQILKIFDKRKRQQQKYKLNGKLNLLIKNRFLKFEKTKSGKSYLSLTQKGKLEFFRLNNQPIPRPKKWDKVWRVVIFDVPKSKDRLRDTIRFHLKKIGFTQLQKSVWVFPFDCEELILLLKKNFKFGKEVLYMKVTSIENDSALRKHFNLKK